MLVSTHGNVDDPLCSRSPGLLLETRRDRDRPGLGRSTKRDNRTNRGFSLIELLIVVGIIMVIAAIAVPSLLRSRKAANESAAVTHMKLLNIAQEVYRSATDEFGSIDALVADGILDERFSTAISGYTFDVDVSDDGLDFIASANATNENNGRYDYYSTPDYVVRYSTESSRAPTGLAGSPVE